MLKKIAIDNFKAFRHFEINDIPLVTLLSGKNGVGKSTLLEAIFFNFCIPRPGMLDIVQVDRALRFKPFYLLPHLFHDQNIKQHISLSLDADEFSCVTTCSLSAASPFISSDSKEYDGPATTNPQTAFTVLNVGRKITFDDHTEPNSLSIIFEGPDHIRYDGTWAGIHTTVSFVNVFNSKWPVEEMLSKIQDKKLEGDLLDYMRVIAPRLERFRVAVEGGQTIVKCGLNDMENDVPLGYMGEGVVRAFTVLLLILSSDSDIILVDEVENGIHYSALNGLWEAILLCAKKKDRQIFLTTHSYECISAAATASEKLGLDDTDFALYRLKGEGSGVVRASRYERSQLVTALNANWEVR